MGCLGIGHVKIKYYEWVRHGIGEPLLKVQIFKKVEDGKVVRHVRHSLLH